MITTIKLHSETKNRLDRFREYKNESYDEVINKIVYVIDNIEKNPEISKETINQIEKSRERIKRGKFITESEAKKRLGL